MRRDDWTHWFREKSGLVAVWKPGGLLSRDGRVPEGGRGLPVSSDGQLLGAGEEVEGPTILVRDGALEVTLESALATDREGVEAKLVVVALVDPPDSRVSTQLLRDHVLKDCEQFAASDLAALLEPIVNEAVEPLVRQGLWDGESGVVGHLRSSDFLSTRLHARLFEMGLSLLRVVSVEAVSPEISVRRKRESELRREAARIRDSLEFIDLWKKEEMGQALARAEVEKMASHLEREGLLRQLEVERDERRQRLEQEREEAVARGQLRRMLERERLASEMAIDSDRLDAEIARARRLEESLRESGLLGMVQSIDDISSRERLLELLIQKEMTPEQIAARAPGEALATLEERFDQRLQELAQTLRSEVRGGRAPDWHTTLPSIDRIWLAVGLGVYRIDGDAAFADAEPTPVLPPEDLGYLRSVQVTGAGSQAAVLVGAQGGALVYRPEGSHWMLYPYHPQPRGRGGVNSVALVAGGVVASHSEGGLHQWQNGSRGSEALHDRKISAGRSTRGVQVGPQGDLFFAHGEEVLRFAPGSQDLVSCGVLPASVTALEATPFGVFAGTREGRLYEWSGEQEWKALQFRGDGPIFRVFALETSEGNPGFAVGAREPAVHILDRSGARIGEYRARNPIRWVGAGRQGVVGVDRFGQHLLLWRWDDPSQPARRIRLPDQIQYLAIERGGE